MKPITDQIRPFQNRVEAMRSSEKPMDSLTMQMTQR